MVLQSHSMDSEPRCVIGGQIESHKAIYRISLPQSGEVNESDTVRKRWNMAKAVALGVHSPLRFAEVHKVFNLRQRVREKSGLTLS